MSLGIPTTFFLRNHLTFYEKRHQERGKCEGVRGAKDPVAVAPIVLQNALIFSIGTPYLVDPSPKVMAVMIPFNIVNALVKAQLS